MWEEEVTFNRAGEGDEKKSIKHCKNSDYKYKIFYAVGRNFTFTNNKLIDNKHDAVSIKNY